MATYERLERRGWAPGRGEVGDKKSLLKEGVWFPVTMCVCWKDTEELCPPKGHERKETGEFVSTPPLPRGTVWVGDLAGPEGKGSHAPPERSGSRVRTCWIP